MVKRGDEEKDGIALESDSPWKEALEKYFRSFVEFFFPKIAADIDWDVPFTFLDKELEKVVVDAELGTRLVDKLIQVQRRNGEQTWILIHVEVQDWMWRWRWCSLAGRAENHISVSGTRQLG